MNVFKRYSVMLGVILLMTTLLSVPAFAVSGFSDVPMDSVYYDGVMYLAEEGITVGTGGNRYSPEAPITVRQWAVMLCRAFEQEDAQTNEEAPFGDLCVRQGYADGWLTETAVLEPETKMCRGALMLSLLRAMDYDIYDYALYPNGVHLTAWENALRIGKELGLCAEDAASSEIMTRGEIATLLKDVLTTEYEIPEPPMVEAFSIVNESEMALNPYLLELRRVPEPILQAYADEDWKYIIDFDYMKQFSTERGGSYIGATAYAKKQIIVSDHAATVHEFGHFLDSALHFPEEHKALFASESQAAGAILGDYSKTNYREYFAEYFEYWINCRENADKMEHLKTVSPQTFSYFTSLEAQNWCAPAA